MTFVRTRSAALAAAVSAVTLGAAALAGVGGDATPTRDAIALVGLAGEARPTSTGTQPAAVAGTTAPATETGPAQGIGEASSASAAAAPRSAGGVPTGAAAAPFSPSGSAATDSPGAAASAVPSAAPSQAPSAPATAPSSPAGPCTTTGTTKLTVDLTDAGLTCAQATSLLTAYLAAPDDGTHGNTKTLVVSGWACQSPTAARSATTGVRVLCAKGAETLLARAG
ncbi:MAG: hypothetical protein IPK37_12770 [Austwickia sp.]|jgi:hypothetical protein|nr:MAG: hypothetical protein IPK37_12770 [Austwickia sp.]